MESQKKRKSVLKSNWSIFQSTADSFDNIDKHSSEEGQSPPSNALCVTPPRLFHAEISTSGGMGNWWRPQCVVVHSFSAERGTEWCDVCGAKALQCTVHMSPIASEGRAWKNRDFQMSVFWRKTDTKTLFFYVHRAVTLYDSHGLVMTLVNMCTIACTITYVVCAI